MTRCTPAAILIVASIGLLSPAAGQEVHFSPEERPDVIDAELIGAATLSIDFASYALTNPVVIDALEAAEHRGIAVRIVLDPSNLTTSTGCTTSPATSGSSGLGRSCT